MNHAFQVVHIRRRSPPKPCLAPIVISAKPPSLLTRIVEIKEQARRMRPPMSHRPESWHEEKSDLLHALEMLEADLRGGRVA